MAYYLSPVFQDAQLATSTGAPLVGGKLYTYLAGSTTPATVYQSNAGTGHTNPIILNARGEPPAPIWINGGQSIKFVLNDASDVLIRTIDNVAGVDDPSGISNTVSEWVTFAYVPTYVSASSFTVTGNQTATLNVGRRVKIPVSGNTSYGTITASVFGALTTVTIDTTGSVGLDSSISSLSSFEIGLLSGVNQSVPYPLASYEFTTGGVSGTYTVATVALGALLTGQRFRAKFHTAGPSTGTSTLNRDGLGAKGLKRYNTAGAKIDATITADLLTDIEYDGTDFVVLMPLDLPHAKQRFTADGTFTVPLGVTTVYVSGAGAGGGGAGVNAGTRGGGGGGGGQCVIAESISVTPGAAIAVGIGTGGSGGGAGINGNSGSKATTFGGLLSLAAGSGGNYSTGAGGSSGGSGGSAGGWGGGQSGVDTLTGGIGGGTCFGMGGAGGNAYSQIGQVGSGYGSGGGGGGQLLAGTQGAGGDGRPGFLLVEW